MFFENFPTTFHTTLNNEKILVTDWIRAIKIPKNILEDQNLYQYYTAKDNETPEIISHKFYKSTQYHWVIMVLNQRFDVWNDYPRSDATIRRYVSDLDGVHHYINDQGEIVDAYTYPRIPVTNYEHAISENEKKRIIKVLQPSYLAEFISVFQQLIEN